MTINLSDEGIGYDDLNENGPRSSIKRDIVTGYGFI